MNAFTAADWTAYPFATQNRKISKTYYLFILMLLSRQI
ncbi:putative metalloprotease domain protein [Acinetobacter baumannii 1428368]|nr:putative metalloprotease domain protein [Acinetobacter baumannii 1428368]